MTNKCLYGIAAEFDTAEGILEAARHAKEEGYEDLRAFTPYEVHGLIDILGKPYNWLPWIVIGALLVGAAGGWILQYVTDVVVYPINVAGRPFYSWPAFVQVSFETAILTAGVATFAGFLVQTQLPLPYHPIFNTPNIELASRDHFFLVVEASDNRFDLIDTREFLLGQDPIAVSEVAC